MHKSWFQRITANHRKLAIWIGVIIGLWVLSGVVLPSGGGNDKPATTEASKQEMPVNQVKVATQTMQAEPKTQDIVLNGVTEPDRVTMLEAQTESEVRQILVKEGQSVKAGDKLVQLDLRDRADRVREARALVQQRRIEYNASKKLQEKGFQSDVGLARSLTELEAAKRSLKQVELDLSYTTIKAPYDGIIDDIVIEEGDVVGRGFNKQAVVELVDLDPIRITGQVAENEMMKLKEGTTASIRLASGKEFEGTIRFISKVAESEARSFHVEVEVPNEDGLIPAGVSAEITLPGETVNAYRISASIMALDDDGRVGVKMVDDQQIVHFVPVEVISQSEKGVWISGLPDQVTLVTGGVNFIADGQKLDQAGTKEAAEAEAQPVAMP